MSSLGTTTLTYLYFFTFYFIFIIEETIFRAIDVSFFPLALSLSLSLSPFMISLIRPPGSLVAEIFATFQ